MARGGSGSRRAQSIVALSANRLGTHGPRPRGMCVQKQKQRTRGHYELGRIYWADVFCCMAHAHLYLLCTGDVGVFVGRGNFLSDWNLAWVLSLVSLMDEDTKLVLQMWRVQVMVNNHLQRRVEALERELGYTYVAQRFDNGRSDADWRPGGHSRRRDPDSDD